MNLNKLSATAIDVFETCEARFATEYGPTRIPQAVAPAADLGTACHEALETLVAKGEHLNLNAASLACTYFEVAYWKLFKDSGRLDEGKKMMRSWVNRHGPEYWKDRTVVSLESKETFDLPYTKSDGTAATVPVTYIMDRLDLVRGEPEVIDYKSYSQPVHPDEMMNRIQVRLYAVAAMLKYPDADAVWVTYDLLRYDDVSVRLSKERNRQTWNYLKDVAARVEDSQGDIERPNSNCRWCVRRHECSAFEANKAIGSPIALTDMAAVAKRRHELVDIKRAVGVLLDDLDEILLQHLHETGNLEDSLGGVNVKVGARGTRSIVDQHEFARVIGRELCEKYGNFSMKVVDNLLTGPDLTEEQKAEVRRLVRKQFSSPSIKTDVPSPLAASPF